MTSPDGLLLEIREDSELEADYIYGGCRKADVRPLDAGGNDVASVKNLQGYFFPAGYAARTLIRGGKHINNVYGGNDISGKIYFGCALGVYTTIYGDVYGGGNGSYPYTDNSKLKGDLIYGDFYYSIPEGKTSVEALNDFRPNAEQVSLRLAGAETKKTIIHGGVYVGGNSATLIPKDDSSVSELKIGSYVIADSVFLGNNGANMVKYNEQVVDPTTQEVTENEGVLRTYTRNDLTSDNSRFTSLYMTNAQTFAAYMDGCAMKIQPSVVFDDEKRHDPATYIPYSTYIGSLYCGGNVGSYNKNGKITININHPLVIFEKLVGGSNNAVVPASYFNVEFVGGVIGDPAAPVEPQTIGDKLEINLSGLKIEPKRWAVKRNSSDYSQIEYDTNGNLQYLTDNGNPYLEWNTQIDGKDCAPITEGTGTAENPIISDDDDMKRRLVGGNIYGGCCKSGVVNGNVIFNLNTTILNRSDVFDEVQMNSDDGEASLYQNNTLGYNEEQYHILQRHSGVILGQQGMDVLGKALNVFGGGKGAGTEIWGSTTINMNKGYVFQVFGGSEEGVIGKSDPTGDYTFTYAPDKTKPEETVTKKLKYDNAYSCYVNLKGSAPGVSMASTYNINMPECEFIYGGGFEGPVAGNTVVSLGNGRIFNSFAGSCDADILGHTETYIGYRHHVENEKGDVTGQVDGFPYIRDMVYGGNDLGGAIKNSDPKDFSDRLRTYDANVTNDPNNFNVSGKVYKKTYSEETNPKVLTASSYVEYNQGHTQAVFGGHFGTYKYSDYEMTLEDKPYLDNTFVNFRPTSSDLLKNPDKKNTVNYVYGGSQGYPGDFDSNRMQDRSYVLIDIPEDMDNFKTMQVFGAGAWGGLGMKGVKVASDASEINLDKKSAIIDLVRGKISAAYGGSYHTGFTRRTVVNVPTGSKIQVNNLFGGSFGESLTSRCDVYEANVNYKSADAIVKQAIYGGNNAYRRTLYGRVTIEAPVYTGELDNNNIGKLATVYGAGYGADTWSQYTEVNLEENARVAEVYGGGQLGRVMNTASVGKWAVIATQDLQTKYKEALTAWNGLTPEMQAETPKPVEPKLLLLVI